MPEGVQCPRESAFISIAIKQWYSIKKSIIKKLHFTVLFDYTGFLSHKYTKVLDA